MALLVDGPLNNNFGHKMGKSNYSLCWNFSEGIELDLFLVTVKPHSDLIGSCWHTLHDHVLYIYVRSFLPIGSLLKYPVTYSFCLAHHQWLSCE